MRDLLPGMKTDLLVLPVILSLLLIRPLYVNPQQKTAAPVESITGILVKVDGVKHVILIRSNKRITRFYATAELCYEFKDSINSKVTATFMRKNEGGLKLLEMRIIR